MRTKEQIETMLNKLTKDSEQHGESDETQAMMDTLTWVLYDYLGDDRIEQYLNV